MSFDQRHVTPFPQTENVFDLEGVTITFIREGACAMYV